MTAREFGALILLSVLSGSRHVYGKGGAVARLSIPIHGNRPLKIGLLRHLAKLAEMPDGDLEWVSSRRYPVESERIQIRTLYTVIRPRTAVSSISSRVPASTTTPRSITA